MAEVNAGATAGGALVPGVPPFPPPSLACPPKARNDEDQAGGADDDIDDCTRGVGVDKSRDGRRDSPPRVGRDPRLMDIVGMDEDVDVAARRTSSSSSSLPILTSMENLAIWNRIHAARGIS